MSEDPELDEFVKNEENPPNLKLGPTEIDIPPEWGSEELSNLFNLISGNNYTGKHLSEEDNGGRIFLTLKSVNKGGGFNQDSIKYYTGDVNQREIVEPGELLIANTDVTQDGDVVGYSIRVPDFDLRREIAASMDLSTLRPKTEDVNLPFIEYLIQTDYIHSRMRAFSGGSTVLHLNTDLVESLSLPLPPLNEQRKIATVLYTVDRAIQKNEELEKQVQRIKKGLMQDLLSGKVRTTGNQTLKNPNIIEENALDEFADEVKEEDAVDVGSLQQLEKSPITEWNLKKLGSLLTLKYGDNLPSNSRKEGDVPVFGSNGQVDTHNESAVTDPGIIIGRKGSIGEIEFSEIPFWPIDTTYYVTANETDENLRFLYYLLHNIRLERLNAASAIPGLNRNDAYGLNALVPPLSEQRKIATVLQTVDRVILKKQKRRDQLQRIKKGLMQDLLSGEVRTHDKDIELADDILKHG